jgi:hypothetical protein
MLPRHKAEPRGGAVIMICPFHDPALMKQLMYIVLIDDDGYE